MLIPTKGKKRRKNGRQYIIKRIGRRKASGVSDSEDGGRETEECMKKRRLKKVGSNLKKKGGMIISALVRTTCCKLREKHTKVYRN